MLRRPARPGLVATSSTVRSRSHEGEPSGFGPLPPQEPYGEAACGPPLIPHRPPSDESSARRHLRPLLLRERFLSTDKHDEQAIARRAEQDATRPSSTGPDPATAAEPAWLGDAYPHRSQQPWIGGPDQRLHRPGLDDLDARQAGRHRLPKLFGFRPDGTSGSSRNRAARSRGSAVGGACSTRPRPSFGSFLHRPATRSRKVVTHEQLVYHPALGSSVGERLVVLLATAQTAGLYYAACGTARRLWHRSSAGFSSGLAARAVGGSGAGLSRMTASLQRHRALCPRRRWSPGQCVKVPAAPCDDGADCTVDVCDKRAGPAVTPPWEPALSASRTTASPAVVAGSAAAMAAVAPAELRRRGRGCTPRGLRQRQSDRHLPKSATPRRHAWFGSGAEDSRRHQHRHPPDRAHLQSHQPCRRGRL